MYIINEIGRGVGGLYADVSLIRPRHKEKSKITFFPDQTNLIFDVRTLLSRHLQPKIDNFIHKDDHFSSQGFEHMRRSNILRL